MNRYLALILLLVNFQAASAQNDSKPKPAVEFADVNFWPAVGGEQISADGNFMYYTIYNQPAGTSKLILRSAESDWKKELSGVSSVRFSGDSKYLVYKKGIDSLYILNLGMNKDAIYISDVGEYNLHIVKANERLVYRSTRPDKALVIYDLVIGAEQRFFSVGAYLFSDDGENLMLDQKDSNDLYTLKWINPSGGKSSVIWTAQVKEDKPVGYAFSDDGKQLAFTLETKRNDLTETELWYYKFGMVSAQVLVTNQSAGIDKGLTLANTRPEFSKDCKRVFFQLQRLDSLKPEEDAVKLDIWSYLDSELQSIQLTNSKNIYNNFTSAVDIDDKKVVQLVQNTETIVSKNNPDFLLVQNNLSYYNLFESTWNRKAQTSYFLVSAKDGSRKLVKSDIIYPHGNLGMSPLGKWIIYYDFEKKDFFSYETFTGIRRNITRGSNAVWGDENNDRPDPSLTWVPWRRTWLGNDEAVLIYDSYDIWEVDPSGTKPPINLTNGYGRIHHIKFELLAEGSAMIDFSVQKKSTLILRAVNMITKERGFYSKTLGINSDLQQLTMGPYVYGEWRSHGEYNYPPIKATKADGYLVKRMSAAEYPNLFFTQDFKNFTPLTDFQPQKNYNWLTSELVHWKSFDGKNDTGILYKPEDFDSTKKYPVIFTYYEMRSDELNLFRPVRTFGGDINIPWFVSHGYLVFVPDIRYKIGEPGPSAYNAIVSAADYLSKKNWIDNRKMGLDGHSFGGYETNFVVSHSHLFAAACSASGISDLISFYGSDARGSYTKFSCERTQFRMGCTPWQNKQGYISNSPIFYADKVTTPLLLMSNKGDGVVPFAQGVEFFTSLRRLEKKVWMLQYDNGRHDTPDTEDYSTRVIQFFDHYLKGAPAPVWMTRGIQAKFKGIDDGLELDTEIKTSGAGLNE